MPELQQEQLLTALARMLTQQLTTVSASMLPGASYRSSFDLILRAGNKISAAVTCLAAMFGCNTWLAVIALTVVGSDCIHVAAVIALTVAGSDCIHVAAVRSPWVPY